MKKDWFDKCSKELHCADCNLLDNCIKNKEPLYRKCCEQYLRDRVTELEQENESYQKLINDICNKHRVVTLKDLDEILQATTESLYASRKYLEELKSEKWGLEKALGLAVEELDDAKDMLRECGKNEWAGLLNTSADYFQARGKEVGNDRK